MSENKPIQLGLCCLNLELKANKPPIYGSRKMIIKSIEEKGIETLKEKIISNLEDTLKMIEWNEKYGIKVFRLSSDLFPHKSNINAPQYELDFAKELLEQIGNLAKSYNQRLTFHPGQYNVIGTPNKKSLDQTIRDLSYHATVLDMINAGDDSVMVIHGGGLYGDKEETKKRWIKQYKELPEFIRKRLVLENCERCFSIKDCLDVSKETLIPVVFDTHHFECYKQLHPDEVFEDPEYYIKDILDSWGNIKPKFHVSEQGKGKCGHHSDYIETIPDYLLEIPEKYNINIDIMIEAKMKEKAIFRLYEKYPFLNCAKSRKIVVKTKQV